MYTFRTLGNTQKNILVVFHWLFLEFCISGEKRVASFYNFLSLWPVTWKQQENRKKVETIKKLWKGNDNNNIQKKPIHLRNLHGAHVILIVIMNNLTFTVWITRVFWSTIIMDSMTEVLLRLHDAFVRYCLLMTDLHSQVALCQCFVNQSKVYLKHNIIWFVLLHISQ